MRSRLGVAVLLGADEVFRARETKAPFYVFDDALRWLRGHTRGAVIVDWERAAGEIEGVEQICSASRRPACTSDAPLLATPDNRFLRETRHAARLKNHHGTWRRAPRVFEPANHQHGEGTNGETIATGHAVSIMPATAYTPEPVSWLLGGLACARKTPPAGWRSWHGQDNDCRVDRGNHQCWCALAG